MSNLLNNVHDRTFTALMGQRSFVKGIFRMHLPKDVQEMLDWDTVALYKMDTKQIHSPFEKVRHADVVYTARLADEVSFFTIHVEHQSSADRLMPIRILNYQTGIMLNYAESNSLSKLPPLLSLIYYHGEDSPYPYSLAWHDCFEDSAFAKQYTFKPILVDLGAIADADIEEQAPAIAGAQLAFKYILSEDFSPYRKRVFAALQKSSGAVRRIALKYVMERANTSQEALIEESERYLPQELEYVMQFYQQQQQSWKQEGILEGLEQGILKGREQGVEQGILKGREQGVEQGILKGREQGVEQGVEQGMRQVALSMLDLGQRIDFISKVTGLSVDKLEALRESV